MLVDSEPDTWNIDPELLEEAIKDRIAKTGKKPAAIVPVALYGMPYKADRIMEIVNKYGIPVVEEHLKHHKHVQKMYEELLADVPGVHVHSQPDVRCKMADVRWLMVEG